jgi:hypothetical protein
MANAFDFAYMDGIIAGRMPTEWSYSYTAAIHEVKSVHKSFDALRNSLPDGRRDVL